MVYTPPMDEKLIRDLLPPMDEKLIRDLLEELETMLRDPTVQIAIARGVHRSLDLDTGFWTYEPTAGRTITITVHGGAKETETDVLTALRRDVRKL